MPLQTTTVAFDLSDLAGVDFDSRRTKVYATTNVVGSAVIDTDGNHIYLGSGTATVNTDGTGTLAVPTPGAGSNPASWQTTVHVDYPDRNADRGRAVRLFGPFTITAAATSRTVTNKALTSNVATLTVSVAHGLTVGQTITVTGVDGTFNGTYTIASVPTSTTVTYAKTASNVTSVAATGTLTSPNVNLADLVAEMPTQPEYEMTVLNRIDGVDDHGSVSGAVELDSEISTHWLDATGATLLTLTDGPSGEATRYVSVLVISGAEDVTIDGLEDLTLADGLFATFAWVRGAWMLAGSGGESAPADVTPPSAVTDLEVDPDDDGVTATATFTPATDTESTVKYRYRLYPTGDTPPAWPTSGAQYNLTSSPILLTGLTIGEDYTMELQAYSSGGSAAADSATFSTPTPAGWNTVFIDPFTDTDDTLLASHAATGGTWADEYNTARIRSNEVIVWDAGVAGSTANVTATVTTGLAGADAVEALATVRMATEPDSSQPEFTFVIPDSPGIKVGYGAGTTLMMQMNGFNSSSSFVQLVAPVQVSATRTGKVGVRKTGNTFEFLDTSGATVATWDAVANGYANYINKPILGTVQFQPRKFKTSGIVDVEIKALS